VEADEVRGDGSYLSGVGLVFTVWWLVPFCGWVAWVLTHEVYARGVLLMILVGLSAAASPLYGGIIYLFARHRRQFHRARAAAVSASVLFVLGAGFCTFMYYVGRALQHLR